MCAFDQVKSTLANVVGSCLATITSSTWDSSRIGGRVSASFSDYLGLLRQVILVTAAYEWDDPPQNFTMNKPIPNSIERVLDEAAQGDSFVITHKVGRTCDGENVKVEISGPLSE